jgi:hypothetical protein
MTQDLSVEASLLIPETTPRSFVELNTRWIKRELRVQELGRK